MAFNQTEEDETKEQTVLLPWVSLEQVEKHQDNGLSYLDSVQKFYIYKNIQIFDRVFDSPKMTRNCLTVRNRFFQQIYYIGTEGNKKPGKILPFTLRIIDQYNKLVILIKKYFKPCFSEQIIDIECPPGILLAKMIRNKKFNDERIFFIYGSDSIELRFIITRHKFKKNDFQVFTKKLEPIASICKRYEKILAVDKSVVHEDHYLRLSIEDKREILNVWDKAIILSATLIVDIFFINRL